VPAPPSVILKQITSSTRPACKTNRRQVVFKSCSIIVCVEKEARAYIARRVARYQVQTSSFYRQLHRDPDVLFAGYKAPHPLEYKILFKVGQVSSLGLQMRMPEDVLDEAA
jgi:hypothetical protein